MGMVQSILHWYDTKTSWLEKAYVWLLAGVLFGIVLHAPISVGFGALAPDISLTIKSWKEILLGLAGVLLVVILTTKKQWGIFHSKLFYFILAFAGINLLLVPVFYTGLESTLAGLLINLRYLFMFALVFAAVRLYPKAVPLFLSVVASGAAVVILFALLQLTVLPHDILKYIGYGESTIMPYLTVDQNMDFVRINSTLRGPNPLGAYMIVVLTLILASMVKVTKPVTPRWRWVYGIVTVSAVIILWTTYSRSAILGAAIALGVVALVVYGRRITRGVWLGVGVVGILLMGGLVAAKDTSFVSNVILHENPGEGGTVNSNDQHAESLAVGVERMLKQPFGGGIGSTGSASLYTDAPIVIENQYLFIAHELGWFGLAAFLAILGIIFVQLWRNRAQWLSLGVFASGVALVFVGLIQPVWVDDTVAIVWWALAGMAVAIAPRSKKKEVARV
ncbi:O-antigen ligase family protein [Candidatus Saccharibacteria bacterium TM7i]|nr:O-antigen ligase family protein [Candidatus Saccharibacteria bacterium TM7i]